LIIFEPAGDVLEGLALMDAIAGDGDPFYEVGGWSINFITKLWICFQVFMY
jgi:hypothetical protein